MKKQIVICCIMALCLSFTACGKGDGNGGSGSGLPQESESVETPESSSAAAPESSSAATQESGSGETQGNVSGAGADFDAGTWSEEMEAVKKAVTDALGEDYWPNTMIFPEMLEGNFGITSDLYEDFLGEMPMISTNVDTLVVVKAKDGKAADVEAALKDYRENEINQTMQYPMNVDKNQASMVETMGNYVCYVRLGADPGEVGGDEAIAHCQEQNQIALDAIRSVVVK